MNTTAHSVSNAELLAIVITSGLMIFLILFIIFVCIRSSKFRKASNKSLKEKIDNGFVCSTSGLHTTGLPVSQGIACTIEYYKEKMIITCSNTVFNLPLFKIIDVCFKSETEINSQYVSSIGGAVAGGLLFGPLGAIVGGRAKKKKDKTVSYFLIITYKDNEEIKYISVESGMLSEFSKFTDAYRKNNTSRDRVEISL